MPFYKDDPGASGRDFPGTYDSLEYCFWHSLRPVEHKSHHALRIQAYTSIARIIADLGRSLGRNRPNRSAIGRINGNHGRLSRGVGRFQERNKRPVKHIHIISFMDHRGSFVMHLSTTPLKAPMQKISQEAHHSLF